MEINSLIPGMLKKINRLKKKKDFEKVLKDGKGFKEDFLLFKIIKNNLKISRFGFIISQRVSKKATVRNKLKRKMSELVKIKLEKIKRGIDGTFIVFPGLENKDFWEIEGIIEKIFTKAKILK
jgi:ribonuclease P protein component